MVTLRGVWKRFFAPSQVGQQADSLPQDIREGLAGRNFQVVQLHIQQLLQGNPRSSEFDVVMAEARRLGWSSRDIGKLDVFGHYYRGDLALAYNGATGCIEAEGFEPDLLVIATLSLYYLGQFKDAYRVLSGAAGKAELFSQRVDFHTVAAMVCWATNHLEEAEKAITEARRLDPDNTGAALHAYVMCFEFGALDAVEEVRREFAAGKHRTGQMEFALALVELARNNYPQGFHLMEVRYTLPEARNYMNAALFELPRWQGQDLANEILLISAEQGIGDTIMLARYLPLAASRGKHIVMETQPETLSLLSYNFPEIPMVTRDYAKLPPVPFDLWTGTMSLPFIFESTADNIPGKEKYLEVPPESLTYWQHRVDELACSGRRLRVGLTWSGSPTHRSDLRRSIPFTQLEQVVQGLDVDFFALQTTVPDIRPANIYDVSEELITLADTAALIDCMDFVITVDTSAVHLAGALGKETWLLLPYRYEWRWGLEGEENNWYDSVTVIRQTKGGDWETVLQEVFGRRLLNRMDSFGRS